MYLPLRSQLGKEKAAGILQRPHQFAAPHTGQSLQLFYDDANDRNTQLLTTVARSVLVQQVNSTLQPGILVDCLATYVFKSEDVKIGSWCPHLTLYHSIEKNFERYQKPTFEMLSV